MPASVRSATIDHMKRRVLAAFLWFYAGWYLGSYLAEMFGVTPLLGPIIGAALAAIVVGDPRRIIWTERSASEPTHEVMSDPA
jgi:hypothetical protein